MDRIKKSPSCSSSNRSGAPAPKWCWWRRRRALNPDRFRVICGLLTPDAEQVIPAHLPTVDFRMPGLNGWVWLRFFLQLCWVIYRRRVDLLHVNSYVPGNYARLAAALMQVPIIIDHWHGFTRFSRKRRLICRVLGRFTDLSLAVSRGVRDYLVSEGRLGPRQGQGGGQRGGCRRH